MSSIREFLSARDEYITRVKEELLGPGSEISIPDSEHELITNSPDVRYSIGILFPKNNKLNADSNDSSRVEEESGELPEDPSDEDEGTEGDGKEKPDPVAPAEEENLDEEISLAAQNMPSSLGFTFLVSSDPQLLKCEVIFATYRRATMPDCRIPFSPDCPEKYAVPPQLSSYVVYDNEEKCLKLRTGLNRKTVRDLHEQDFLDGDEYGIFPAMYKLCDQLKGGYVRVPHNADVVIDFSSGDYVDNNKRLDETSAKITALKRKINENLYSVTVMLVNDDEEKSNGTRCLFQPTVKIKSDVNGFRFCEYSSLVDFNLLDAEEQSLELQYRNKRVYGTGLGTSVNWNIDADGNGEIYNDFFPETEVPSMDFSIPQGLGIHKEALSMRHLSDLDQTEKSQKLSELKSVADAYSGWIDTLKEKQQELSACYKAAAESNIAGCLKARNRMLAGLKVLNDDSVAWTAFSLANRAMFMQRVHLKLQSDMADIDRYPGDEDLTKLLETLDYGEPRSITGDNYAWRLFQIAFLLMSIESVTNDTACDRDVVDLIWFPTGGGKTEAYLGLTAFTIEETDIIQLIHDIIVGLDQGGTFYVFYDRLQLIQAKEMPKFIGDLDCRLTLYRNCRNTENIAVTSLRPITERKPKVFEGTVKGAPARIHFCDSVQNERERIDSIIDNLAADGYRDVVLLTCKTEATSILSDSVNNGRYRNKYLFTTCRKFKGLEADVVILLDVDKATFEQENVLIFYVGTSRARIKLEITAILSDDDCKEILTSVLNYQGKIRRAKKDFAGALNAIGCLET